MATKKKATELTVEEQLVVDQIEKILAQPVIAKLMEKYMALIIAHGIASNPTVLNMRPADVASFINHVTRGINS